MTKLNALDNAGLWPHLKSQELLVHRRENAGDGLSQSFTISADRPADIGVCALLHSPSRSATPPAQQSAPGRLLGLMSTVPPAFPEVELERALSEQSFGVKAYKIISNASDLEASAQVQLLEGHWIKLSLTTQGYQVSVPLRVS